MKRASKANPTPKEPLGAPSRELEQAILGLENACLQVLDEQFSFEREDIEAALSERRLKNLVSRLSLALRECKGPRHFHQHYRHQKEDDSVLVPVLDDPLETLRQVCQSALAELQSGFSGSQSASLGKGLRMLEQHLRQFMELKVTI